MDVFTAHDYDPVWYTAAMEGQASPWVILTMGEQSLQVLPVFGTARFAWRGGAASILSGRHMAFLGNGDSPPAASMMVAGDTNFGDVSPTRVSGNVGLYQTWF